jgi:hypothetical protein
MIRAIAELGSICLFIFTVAVWAQILPELIR